MFPSLGSGMPGRAHPRRTLTLGASALLVLSGLVSAVPALASHPEVSLPGSNFEIDTDANLKQDDASPSIDWASVAEIRKQDTTSGQTDESFGNGTKEDTAVPSVVDGGIPPNKSDLKFFGLYQEGNTSTGFLNLFWSRVQEPSGTTNMDFELNHSNTPSANGITPVRTAGDVLIQYDLSQGGVNPVISISRWVTTGSKSQCEAANSVPCWSTKTPLGGDSAGSINTSAILAADSDGIGGQDPRTFGEAQLRLSTLFPPNGACESFGAAYLKSRSSDSFTAALKDFVPPTPINITNCGSVKVKKVDDAGNPLAGATFTLYKDNAPTGGSRGAEDTITTFSCTTPASGICTISDVPAGEYWIVETVTPPGHDTADEQHVTVVAGAESDLTATPFVNPRQRGAIKVTKLRKHAASGSGDHPQAGVNFTVNGVTQATGADGTTCFDNLLFGSYTVHETTPAGYHGEADKTVVVDNKATCSGSPYAGESVTFHNTPLTNVTVSVDSQIDGGTSSTMVCKDADGNTVGSGSTGANGDGSASANDLEPGTYTCTVVIDP